MTLKICRVRPLFFFYVVVIVLVSFTTTTAINKCIDKEKHALLSFKAYIRQDPLNVLSEWTQASNDCCEWYQVTCNNHSRVIGLDLSFSELKGKISHSLLNLSFLNHLDLLGNSFNGTIPVFIGSMTQLRYLDLSFNYFNGTIPVFSGSMTQLRYLDLSGNYFNGTIPVFIDSVTQLRYLKLSRNSFNGTIPVFIGSMTQLRYLDLSGNYFNGTIPVFIGSMTQLRYLNLGSNDFSGTIPSELRNLTNLEGLDLTDLNNCTIESLDWLSHLSQLKTLYMDGISLAKVNNWVNVILSLQNLRELSLIDCNLSHVTHPYSDSSINSSFSSSIEYLSLRNNNLNSSIYHWLFPLTSNTLKILYLSGNKLDRIPKYLGNLCNLTSLYFHNNSMPVKFSDFLKNLSGCASVTLLELDASSNRVTGSLSDDIQSFSSLTALKLSNNQLNGTISEKVFQLPELQTLEVSSNSLKGTISEYIGMTKILEVDFSNNPLEGVPSEAHMLNLSYLTSIDLSSSKQGPHFPKWIQRLKDLSYINLANTRISDTIPEEFWNIWPSQLTYLNLSSNNISGIITDLSSNFAHSTIDLSSNNFYGPIPNVPSSLQQLDLSRNKFSVEIFFLCQINYFSFIFLDLSHNSFIGQIPDCLWQFPNLLVLNLEHNNLSGGLPASIKSLTSLQVLNLYNNSFSGDFPPSLKYCTYLSFLDLGVNMFSGDVPIWIGEKLLRLYALSLTSNNFLGTIPSQLCQLVYLQVLDLSKNNLHGTIPSCFNNLTAMVQEGFLVKGNVHQLQLVFNGTGREEYADHAMIKWQGSVREFGSTLGFMKIINLSSNNLTGKIPDELTNLHQLIALDLSMNNLLGEIPPSIGEMKELQILDLSRNNLSGEIPTNMSLITFLNYLDVSYNNLSGRIPSGTQLQSFDPSRYTGNAGLCGRPLSKYCPGDKELKVPPVIVESEYDEEDTDDLRRLFYIGGVTGFSIGFWMVCIALLSNNRGSRTFFHILNSLKNWVYVKVMVFIAKISKT